MYKKLKNRVERITYATLINEKFTGGKIAAVLSLVQDAIAQQEQLITLTIELKKALMQKLFTQGTRGEPQKMTEIGLIPESWEVVQFEPFADFKNGINFTKEQKGDTGLLTIDVLNMYSRSINVSLDNLYRVNKKINDDFILKKGDILFVRSSLKQEGVGWASLYENEIESVSFCGFIIRARLKDFLDFNPGYLTHLFRTIKARLSLISGSAKLAITNINQSILKQSIIPKPSLSEQEEINSAINLIDQKISIYEQKRDTLKTLFQTLLHQLMTAKIRVDDLNLSSFKLEQQGESE